MAQRSCSTVRACAFLLMFLGGSAFADTQSTFDADAEGWVVAGPDPLAHISTDPDTAPLPWDETEGQPAPSVRVDDQFGWTWIQAPPSWLGNRLSAYGGQISLDILVRAADDDVYPFIAIRGRNVTLYCNYNAPAVGTWTTLSAELVPGYWWINDYAYGLPASEAVFKQVLADVRGIYILTEWHTGDDDTNVDNISLSGFVDPACRGDVNLDGKTTVADFNILAGNFATAVTPFTNGDLTGDGFVNVKDFNIVAGDFACGA